MLEIPAALLNALELALAFLNSACLQVCFEKSMETLSTSQSTHLR